VFSYCIGCHTHTHIQPIIIVGQFSSTVLSGKSQRVGFAGRFLAFAHHIHTLASEAIPCIPRDR
jgi:hypothetical protein